MIDSDDDIIYINNGNEDELVSENMLVRRGCIHPNFLSISHTLSF